eukprot:365558-Chlamydomonas_euryale.AAC.1
MLWLSAFSCVDPPLMLPAPSSTVRRCQRSSDASRKGANAQRRASICCHASTALAGAHGAIAPVVASPASPSPPPSPSPSPPAAAAGGGTSADSAPRSSSLTCAMAPSWRHSSAACSATRSPIACSAASRSTGSRACASPNCRAPAAAPPVALAMLPTEASGSRAAKFSAFCSTMRASSARS